MELDDGYKTDHSNSNGSETAYAVEARYAYPSPVSVGGQIIDNRWRRVKFPESENGVPTAPWFSSKTREHGLLSYPAAQALRWWFHAAADAQIRGGLCLETRLIKYAIKYSSSVTAVSQHCVVKGDDRSNCMPAEEPAAVSSP